MLSTFTKKIIGIEKAIRPFTYRDRSGVSYLIMYKGYEPHFQWFQQNAASFKDNTKIYCYDRCSVDLALEMALRGTTKLSYISTRNYQTVVAINRNSNIRLPENQEQQASKGFFGKQSQQSKGQQGNRQTRIINKKISAKASDILKNYEFVIKNTYLDIHPLQAYQKLCGYLMVRADRVILQQFEGFRCCQQSLFKSFLVLPVLNPLRRKLLIVHQIKTEKLARRDNVAISDEMIKESFESWQATVQLPTFSNATCSFSEKEKFQWVLNNNFGEEVSKKDILNQKYRKFSYALLS